MRLLRIKAENFVTYRTLDLTLPTSGLIGIEGINVDNPAMVSNACLIGSTQIDIPRDLSDLTKGIPIKDLVGKTFYAYCYNLEKKKLELKLAGNVHKTHTKVEVWRVKYTGAKRKGFKDYKYLIGTPDHKILKTNGEYCKIKDLKIGDRLTSLYRRTFDRYTHIRATNDNEEYREHVFISEQINGPNEIVHHKDYNHWNHNPDNLVPLSTKKHMSLHALHRHKNNPKDFMWKEHPRGMLGKKHTQETKKRIGIASIGRKRTKESLEKAKKTWNSKSKEEKSISNAKRSIIHLNRFEYSKKLNKKTLIGLYIEKNLTQTAMARKFNCSIPTIARALKRNNIYKRPHVDSNNHIVTEVSFYGYEDVYNMTVADNHNYVANGVFVKNCGKTVFFDIVSYAVWGEIARKKRANVIGSFETKMKCEVTFSDSTSKYPLSIRRIRSKGGNEKIRVKAKGKIYKGIPTKIQPLIDKLIGMSWLTARNCIIYSDTHEDSFMHSADNKRKEILAEIADILFIREAKKLAVKDRHIAELTLTSAQTTSAMLIKDKKRIDTELQETIIALNDFNDNSKKEIARLEETINRDDISIQQRGVTKTLLQNIRTQEGHSKTLVGLRASLKLANREQKENILYETNRECLRYEHQIDQLQDNLRKIKNDGSCPTCLTPRKQIDTLPITKQINCILNKHNASIQAVDNLKNQLKELNKQREQIIQYEKIISDLEIQKNKIELRGAELEGKRKDLTVTKMELDKVRNKQRMLQDKVTTTNNALHIIKERIAHAFFNLISAKAEYDTTTFWIEKFGQHGIEGDFITDLISSLSNYVGEYIQRLSDGSIGITISPYKTEGKKIRNEIVIDVTQNGKAKDIRLYSGGQRNRIERSINLGLMNLVSNQVQFRMFDEIGKNLSPKGYERTVQLLMDIFENQQIFLITHNTEVRKFFDHKIIIRLEDGESHVKLL